eukprot:COSAG02_NODE_22_length_53020_cov_16.223125_44_plen_95_part_00
MICKFVCNQSAMNDEAPRSTETDEVLQRKLVGPYRRFDALPLISGSSILCHDAKSSAGVFSFSIFVQSALDTGPGPSGYSSVRITITIYYKHTW